MMSFRHCSFPDDPEGSLTSPGDHPAESASLTDQPPVQQSHGGMASDSHALSRTLAVFQMIIQLHIRYSSLPPLPPSSLMESNDLYSRILAVSMLHIISAKLVDFLSDRFASPPASSKSDGHLVTLLLFGR
jgi:hypothetical protein